MRRVRVLLVAAILVTPGCQHRDTPATTEQPQTATPVDTTRIDLGTGTTPQDAVALIRAYYQAINLKHYKEAYDKWEGRGAASGKTFVAFLNSNAQAKRIDATTGAPAGIVVEGTTQTITIPVQVTAATPHGTDQYGGTITLRRSTDKNAPAELLHWHLFKSNLKPPTARERRA